MSSVDIDEFVEAEHGLGEVGEGEVAGRGRVRGAAIAGGLDVRGKRSRRLGVVGVGTAQGEGVGALGRFGIRVFPRRRDAFGRTGQPRCAGAGC
jgi:hypothetical protein